MLGYNNKGSILPWVVICCSVIAVFVSGYTGMVSRDFKIAANEYTHAQAFHSAQAGLEFAMKTIIDDLNILQDFIDENATVDAAELILYPDNQDLTAEVANLLEQLAVREVALLKEAEDATVKYYIRSQGELNSSFEEVIRYLNVPEDGNVIGEGGNDGGEFDFSSYVPKAIVTREEVIVHTDTPYEDKYGNNDAIYIDTDQTVSNTLLDIIQTENLEQTIYTTVNAINKDATVGPYSRWSNLNIAVAGGLTYLNANACEYRVSSPVDAFRFGQGNITGNGIFFIDGNIDANSFSVTGDSEDPLIVVLNGNLRVRGPLTLHQNALLVVLGQTYISSGVDITDHSYLLTIGAGADLRSPVHVSYGGIIGSGSYYCSSGTTLNHGVLVHNQIRDQTSFNLIYDDLGSDLLALTEIGIPLNGSGSSGGELSFGQWVKN